MIPKGPGLKAQSSDGIRRWSLGDRKLARWGRGLDQGGGGNRGALAPPLSVFLHREVDSLQYHVLLCCRQQPEATEDGDHGLSHNKPSFLLS